MALEWWYPYCKIHKFTLISQERKVRSDRQLLDRQMMTYQVCLAPDYLDGLQLKRAQATKEYESQERELTKNLNTLVALENMDANVNISTFWEV
jgi:hypothetical protein